MSFFDVFGKNYIPAPEAKVEDGHSYGLDGTQFTGSLVVGEAGDGFGGVDGFTVNVCVGGVEQDGEVLRMKEGADQSLTVSNIPFAATGTALLGVRDSAGRWLLKVKGTFTTDTAVFNITSKQALGLYEGVHRYDIFSLSNYDEDTGSYDTASFMLGSKVIVLPLNLRLEI